MNPEELRATFIEEATASLQDFEAGLLRLDESPSDREAVDLVFRIAHSLKGGSSMMGYTELTRLTHALENLLHQIREGTRAVTPAVIDTLLASADTLRGFVSRLAAGLEAEPNEASERVHALIVGILGRTDAREGEGPVSTASGAPRLYRIVFRPTPDALRRGLDPLRILAQLADMGEVWQVEPDLTALPPLSQLDPEQCYLAWTVTLLTAYAPDELYECLCFAAGSEGTSVRLLSDPAPPVATHEQPRRRASDRDETVIRVAIEKVDRLVDLVGELVTTQSMLAQAAGDRTPAGFAQLQEAVAHMERHTRDLHHRILAVRMVSVRTLFARFPRLVRDLAAARGKQVRLELSGEDTELDKTVIEKIGDPLLHLVRNAVDHGVETPAERRAAGKPEVGRVRLEAYQEGGSVYIDVSDDGRGLDRERILGQARRHGLLGPSQDHADEEAFALIFRPGFSTAETVTDVSGRGVGMDVVKRNVTALGGGITIGTQAGQGTRFRIKLPLTLAVLEGQMLQVGDQTYVLPLATISESLRSGPGGVHAIEGAGEVVIVRRTSVPLLRLHRLFALPGAVEDPLKGLVVLVEYEGRRVALLVDRLLGQQQVVIKSLGTHFRDVEAIAGATILGDGRVALILDVPGLIDLTRTTAGVGATGGRDGVAETPDEGLAELAAGQKRRG